MRLTRIEIVQLPGLNPHQRIILDALDPHTNVVVGPNASGKSSLVRALRAVLLPDRLRDSAISVSARFADGEDTWQAERLGASVQWLRNGHRSDPPVSVTEVQLDGLMLQIDDLLVKRDGDDKIAQQIARDLAGGFNLQGVRGLDAFAVKARHGSNQSKAFDTAQQNLKVARQAARALANEEERKEDWIRSREASRESRRRVPVLRDAIKLLDTKNERAQVHAKLDTFPTGMSELSETVLKDRNRQLEERHDLDRRLRESQLRRQQAADLVADSALGDRELNSETIQTLRRQVETLKMQDGQLQTMRERLHAARERTSRIAAELGAVPNEDLNLTPNALRAVEYALESRLAAQASHDQLADRHARLAAQLQEGTMRTGDLEEARAAVRRLQEARAKLRDAVSGGGEGPIRSRGLGGVLTALGLAGIGYFLWQSQLVATVFSAILLGVGAWLLVRSVVARPAVQNPADRLRREFETLGVSGPERFTEPEIRTRLVRLDDEIDEGKMHVSLLEQLRDVEREQGRVGERLAQAQEVLEESAREHGFSLQSQDAGLAVVRWLHLAQTWDQARGEALGAEAEIATLLGTSESLARDVSKELAGLRGESTAPDGEGGHRADALMARLDQLIELRDAREQARRELASAADELERLELTRKASATSESQLFAQLGLEEDPNPDASLEALFARWEDWRELDLQASTLDVEIRGFEQGIKEYPELQALVDEGDRAELERRLQENEDLAAQEDALTERIKDVEARVRLAGEQERFAEAGEAHREAIDMLREARSHATFAAAATFLLDDVEEAYEAVTRPKLLQEAERLFSLFTDHAYQLQFRRAAGEAPQFWALEVRTGQYLSLDALSTATRIQAFLAVRMAAATEAEGEGPSLPFVLDEALTTTDPGRFQAVATSLARLARDEGRQVIYLSAREEDAAAWRASMRLDDGEAVGCKIYSLSEDQVMREAPMHEVTFEMPTLRRYPAPDGMTPAAYAKALGVPTINPWSDAAAVHLFHLLHDDLALLHRLLSIGLVRLGQLRTWLPGEGVASMLDGVETSTLKGRMVATEKWLPAWRVGRGRPIDAEGLAVSGIVSSKMLTALLELVRHHDGSAEDILRAIDDGAIPRFQSKKRDELREFFELQGNLSSQEPLSAPQRIVRMMEATRADRAEASEEALAQLDHTLEAAVQAFLVSRSTTKQ